MYSEQLLIQMKIETEVEKNMRVAPNKWGSVEATRRKYKQTKIIQKTNKPIETCSY